ncbi:MAG TPA: integration host factor subunit beta [Thiolinea sp.]|nr:integration host factor subunit beta [Thiolinea sp.]
MNKSDIILNLSRRLPDIRIDDADQAVNLLLDLLSSRLAAGGRAEIRGFGSFSLHERKARMGRNPRTGDAVVLPERFSPHFKPGKELRERVNLSRLNTPLQD